jgi:signal transduction histidine kinase
LQRQTKIPSLKPKNVERILTPTEAHPFALSSTDAQRLDTLRIISDLEHRLGTTQHKIYQILYRLEHITPTADNYAETLRALRDNIEYSSRLIAYHYATLDSDLFQLADHDLTEFMRQYVDSWCNYGGHYFEVQLAGQLDSGYPVRFDPEKLQVLLDALLNNAVRHGFHKYYRPENRVELRLSAVRYHAKPYALLQVSNNGDPLPDGFTLQDYISPRRNSVDSGRSGMGGSHVYQVVKGHHGHLYLGRSAAWNLTVEILLPLEAAPLCDLPEYEHGPECI